jgi:nucleoside-diphosphate-sugar epimerase
MRVVITAMGGLVPELCLLIGELSRRFDRVLVLLGEDVPAGTIRLARVSGIELGHWSATGMGDELREHLDGADAVIHVPLRSEESYRRLSAVTRQSLGCVANALARSRRPPCSFVSVLTTDPADPKEGDSPQSLKGTTSFHTATKHLLDAGVRTCIARTGVILRTPSGPLARTLCALRTQGASARMTCEGAVRWIHILDAVRAIVHMLANESLSGLLNLVAPEPVTADQFATAVWTAFGLPPELRRPATGVARLFTTPTLDGCHTAEPHRQLVESGFSYLFPDLTSALVDIAQTHRA